MVEQDLTLNADLNNDQSDEYKKKDNEVKRRVRQAFKHQYLLVVIVSNT